MPVAIGESSPAVTATIASSSSASPSAVRPASIRRRPCMCIASANRSGSPKRWRDRRRLAHGRDGGVEVAHHLAPARRRDQQVALLHAFARYLLDQPLRAAEPAGAATHLALHHQRHAGPERAPRRAQRARRRRDGAGARARARPRTRRRGRACSRRPPAAPDPSASSGAARSALDSASYASSQAPCAHSARPRSSSSAAGMLFKLRPRAVRQAVVQLVGLRRTGACRRRSS